MSYFKGFIGFIIPLAALFCASLAAAEPLPVALQPNGTPVEAVITNSGSLFNQLIFFFETSGNISERIDFSVEAPEGTTITARTANMANTTALSALASKKDLIPLKLRTSSARELAQITIKAPTLARSMHHLADDNRCSGMTEATINALLESYRRAGINITREDLCSGSDGEGTPPGNGGFPGIPGVIPPGGGTPPTDQPPGTTQPASRCEGLSDQMIANILLSYKVTFNAEITKEQFCSGNFKIDTGSPFSDTDATDPNNQYREFYTLVQKNSCAPANKVRHVVALTLSFKKVDGSKLSPEHKVRVAAKPRKFKGSKASTIKPISEGMWAPEPLVMMSTTGGGSETINVYKWTRKPKQIAKLPVTRYVYYRGLTLANGRVKSVLTGGKGVFELTNGFDTYSVCFMLKRVRQRVNGYTN